MTGSVVPGAISSTARSPDSKAEARVTQSPCQLPMNPRVRGDSAFVGRPRASDGPQDATTTERKYVRLFNRQRTGDQVGEAMQSAMGL
jgi:hypothetical protein